MNCPYCGSQVELTDSSKVYDGKSFGMVWVCTRYPQCDAYVGAHKNGGEPKGTLANSVLRRLRMQAHNLFDPLWMSGKMTRAKAYVLMRQLMDLPKTQCHIGMMDQSQCWQFIERIRKHKNDVSKKDAEVREVPEVSD